MQGMQFILVVVSVLLGSPLAIVRGQASTAPPKEFLWRVQATRADMAKTGATKEEKAALGAHFGYLKELADKGVVILAGYTLNQDESSFGIVILHAASEDAARDIINRDPAVNRRVVRSALFPYQMVLMEGNQGKD